MADGALKYVIGNLLQLWDRGPNVVSLLTDLTGPTANGDAADLPSIASATVNSTETAAVNASALNTIEQLVKNQTLFINEGMTQQQAAQLFGGTFPAALMASIAGDAKDNIDRALVNYLLTVGAGSTLTNAYHRNLAADAIVPMDVYGALGSARGQRGARSQGWAWLGNSIFTAYAQGVTGWQPVANAPTDEVGLKQIANLAGVPYYEHSAVPGEETAMRQQSAISASNIASNVLTVTVPAGHGFVPDQMIYTTGMTANIAITAPVAITSVTATTITFPRTGTDGSNGTGIIYSASSMAMLIYKPWAFYAQDKTMPKPEMVKRDDAAGWALQLHMLYGRYARSGSVWVLHAPDSA